MVWTTGSTLKLPIRDAVEEVKLENNEYKYSGDLMGFYAGYVVLENIKLNQDIEILYDQAPRGFPRPVAKFYQYAKKGKIQGYPYFEVAVNENVGGLMVKFIRQVLLVGNQLFAFEISGPRYRENADSKEFKITAKRFFDSIAISD